MTETKFKVINKHPVYASEEEKNRKQAQVEQNFYNVCKRLGLVKK